MQIPVAAQQRKPIRVVGYRFTPSLHEMKDFLTRNYIPYEWIAPDSHNGHSISDLIDPADLPAVIMPDKRVLKKPSISDVASACGLSTAASEPFYDLLIIGGGPAGLAGAVYAGSEGLNTLVVEARAPGGQASTSSRIENYLGFPAGLSGAELAERAYRQAKRFGVEFMVNRVMEIDASERCRTVTLCDGSKIGAKAILVTTGVQYNTLDTTGIPEYTGRGIYYGAAPTEAKHYAEQNVHVVGGANSAGQAAMYFSRYANSVTMLVRADSLGKSMSQYLIDQIKATDNIKVSLNTVIEAVVGDHRRVTRIYTMNGEFERHDTDGIFILIGARPCTDWIRGTVECDEHGFIVTGRRVGSPHMLETSVPGIFAAGDVRAGSIKRVASAVGEGSMSVAFIHQYLNLL